MPLVCMPISLIVLFILLFLWGFAIIIVSLLVIVIMLLATDKFKMNTDENIFYVAATIASWILLSTVLVIGMTCMIAPMFHMYDIYNRVTLWRMVLMFMALSMHGWFMIVMYVKGIVWENIWLSVFAWLMSGLGALVHGL